MNEFIITRDGDSNEIKHYGVLGMKWGVHRASKKYNKATTKEGRTKASNELKKHMSNASKKLNNYDKKTTKQLNNAIKKRYGFFGNEEKYNKAKAKADKTAYKGDKWYKNMNKAFSKQSVVSISENDQKIGKKFADYFSQKADFADSTYNKK